MPAIETSRLVLRSHLAELDRLASWIEHWAGQSVPPDTTFAVQLCLEEAVANMIMRGAADRDRCEIAVELEHDGETLRAGVEEFPLRHPRLQPGEGEEVARFPSPFAATSPANAGDLSFHLMRSFCDRMHYDHVNQSAFRFAWSRKSAA